MQSVSSPFKGAQRFATNAIHRNSQPQNVSCACLRVKTANAAGLSRSLFARTIIRDYQEFKHNSLRQPGTRRCQQGAVAKAARKKATKTSKSGTSKGINGDSALVTISLQKEAAFGFQYALVGGDPALGDWDPAKAAILDWSEGHVWSTTLDLPADRPIEYKFILVNNNLEAVDWQPGGNRTIATSSNGVGTIQGQWDEELGMGESEDASTDGGMSEGDVSDDSSPEATDNGTVTETKASRGSFWKAKPAGRKRDVAKKNGAPSAEGSLAEADVAPAATPAVQKAADVSASVSNNKPKNATSKPSASPRNTAPAAGSETGSGVNGLAVAGMSALVALTLGAATLFTRHHDTLSDAVGTVGQHSSKILSSVSETGGKHLDTLNGHLEGLSRATGEGLGGLSKSAGEGLGGLTKAANEGFGGFSKAASDGLAGSTKATGEGAKSRR